MTPRVSVVIPCFNYGHHLAEAVESVLAQTLPNVETIIVDAGSTDDSADVAQALIDANPKAEMRLLRVENRNSPGATRNSGVAEARAPYILCLDADDKLDPGFLAACVAALDASPEAAIAYSDFQMFGGDDQRIVAPAWNSRRELDSNFIGTAAVFRREAWEQAGGHATDVRYEDWDFWISIVEHGWQGVKAPGALWHYRVHDGGEYTRQVRDDQAVKAELILKHPDAYSELQRGWARAVLAGETPAQLPRAGVMPPRAAIRSICLITKDYPPSVPGGIPRAMHMQARMLAAAGVQVHVITKAQTGAEGVREDDGVIVHEIAEPSMAVPPQLHYLEIPLWSLMAATKFAQLDQAVGFDVVEAPDYRGEALHLQPRPETPLIVWLHSTMMVVWNSTPGYERTPTDDAWHALEMAALERADLLLAPSQLLLDTTSEFLGDRMRPVELMPYLFDAGQFPAKGAKRSDGPIQVLFYGHIEPRKNPEVALHTVAELRRRGIDAELTILGKNVDFHTERVLQPLAAGLGLSDVRYVPHTDIDGLRATLAGADVAILASRFDNSPLTIFESLSSGVPVITSDKVGTASWIEPENGLLTLPIDDPAEFGRRAADAIDSDWISTGDRAASRMREMFSPEVVTERLLGCYARLMETRERTAPAAGRIEGARGTAVLAFAGELIAEPALLRAWGESFSDADDVTLVIHAPGWSEDEIAAKVGAAVAAAGLDTADAPDLLAWALPLAGGADAVLSRNAPPAPFADLPRVDEDSVAKLSVLLGERLAA